MKIACSRNATVWTLGQHGSEEALFMKEFQRIWKVDHSDALSYRPDALSLIMLLGKSGNTLKGVLPHGVTMTRMATPRQNTLERSLTSPRKFKFMKGLST
jgi:hypothetical protein